MKSYASIDRIEGRFALCEVEMLEVDESKSTDYCNKETKMMEILLDEICSAIESVKEGDIIVIEHNEENVFFIYQKDDEEKQRRIDVLNAIME